MSKEIQVKKENLPESVEAFVGMPIEDLRELDHTAIPTIVNDGEMFKARGANWPSLMSAKEFEAVVLDIHKYEYHRCSNQDHAIAGFYTTDGIVDSRGEPVDEIHRMWDADGCSYTISQYIGAHVLMLKPEEAFNALALVTISPTSVKRFRAYLQLEIGRQRRLQPFQAVTRFKLGESIKGRGGKMFRPWEFEFAGEFDKKAFEESL